jgi:hypothetical protein
VGPVTASATGDLHLFAAGLSGNLFRPVQQCMSDSGAAVPIVNNQCDEPGKGLVSVDERDETERCESGHGLIDVSDE